jgi:dTMP kinase
VAARGRLVALEGGEGYGKSTQAALLAERLGAVLTREPGGTALGERARELLLDRTLVGVDARAEALLVLAARAQHVSEVIEPALTAGSWVVTDRFSGSTLAYQGSGRGLDPAGLSEVAHWAAAGVWPDLNVLIDVPAEMAAARRCGSPDRLEAEDEAFHQRVLDSFRRMASADPTRWVVVDGLGAVEEVATRVLDAVVERLGDPRG